MNSILYVVNFTSGVLREHLWVTLLYTRYLLDPAVVVVVVGGGGGVAVFIYVQFIEIRLVR
jgi:hypothetical protein